MADRKHRRNRGVTLPMKNLAAFCLLLSLTLSSCSPLISYTDYHKGQTYTAWVPDKVAIYKEPVLKSEPYHLAKREDFVVEDVICSDYRFSCTWDILSSVRESLVGGGTVMFYKIRFKSGEYGYIKMNDFLDSGRNILAAEKAVIMARLEPLYYKDADPEALWSAAVDALNELGYGIAEANRKEGIIVTGMKEEENRDKSGVSIRFLRADDTVAVSVDSYSLVFRQAGENPRAGYWHVPARDGHLEQKVKETIASRLSLKKAE